MSMRQVRDVPAFGFYGKVPATGDFVSRGLGKPQVAIVDDWFQQGLMELFRRDENWLESYLVAPVWCFAIPARYWGERPQYGALMASVDRVGRYFPLLVLAELEEGGRDQTRICAHLHTLAAAMPAVLQERLLPDAFEDRLRWLAGSDFDALLAQPAVLEYFQPEGHVSAWWAIRGPDRPYQQLSHRGLPDDDLFCQLFTHYNRTGVTGL